MGMLLSERVRYHAGGGWDIEHPDGRIYELGNLEFVIDLKLGNCRNFKLPNFQIPQSIPSFQISKFQMPESPIIASPSATPVRPTPSATAHTHARSSRWERRSAGPEDRS